MRDLPAPPPEPPAIETPDISEESRSVARYYAGIQQRLLAEGRLRTEIDPEDAPYDNADLARNFVAIALFDEYTRREGQLVQEATASRLRRWTQPVRLKIIFGDTVSPAIQETDRLAMQDLVRQLRDATDHSISIVDDQANFYVFVVNEDERRVLGETLADIMPDIGPEAIRRVEDMPRSDLCLVLSSISPVDSSYQTAIAVIRAEHPALIRQSCLHEEVSQGLGLPNDSPDARPSIFNDDEEFAFLTKQDAELLGLLYNPALRPGMTVSEVRPILTRLLADPAT